MEFGFDGGKSADASTAPVNNGADGNVTDLTTGKTANDVAGEPADDINSISDSGQTKPKGTGATGFDNGDTKPKGDDTKPATTTDDKTKGADDKSNTDSATALVEGAVIEIGDDKYTVDKTGNVLDKDGNIFKEAKDTKDWLASFDTIDDGAKDELSIATIQDAVGIEILDEDEKPIVFENTPAGIKAYIEAVNDNSRDEHYQEAVNTLYQKYPVISDVINYYVANGNSIEGFGQVSDRSGITIDDTNEAQQESIIRTAFTEQGRKGDVESYIAYLKSSGTLLATAKEELTGLQESDAEYKEELAKKAAEAEQQKTAKLQSYWNGVKEVIQSKKIAGYEIPDTIVINRDGKKLSASPNDFYNYVYQLDKNGKSAYENTLSQETPESRRDDELLRAYLKFVGGNYSNLVNMAVNQEKVKVLKLQQKQRSGNSVKVTAPKANTAKGVNTDFGYN